MSGRAASWAIGAALTVAVVLATWLAARATDDGAGASARSRGASGWVGTRRYLEDRGSTVELLDRRVDARSAPRVVVTVFPWRPMLLDTSPDDLAELVRRGGTLVLGHTGNADLREQTDLLGRFGVRWDTVRGEPPLGYRAFRRFLTEEWPFDVVGSARSGVMTAVRSLPTPPAGATALAIGRREPIDGRALAFRFSHGAGQVFVLPAEMLCNARLSRAGNADLLELLRREVDDTWAFDEAHHGLFGAESTPDGRSSRAVDAVLAQIAILYLLGVVYLGRRFGPPWRARSQAYGTTTSFLLGLGALHDRLGHHRDAAMRLVSRVASLEPRLEIPDLLVRRAERADRERFLQIARELAALRAAGGERKRA